MSEFGVTAKEKWVGPIDMLHKLSVRMGTAAFNSAVLKPWKSWVLHRDILEMYRLGGAIPGEQDAWGPLSHWTVEQKGSSGVFLRGGSLSFQFGTMARSYELAETRQGLRSWGFELTNRKRSAAGFDYPSALHTGTKAYIIFPKAPNKALHWTTKAGGMYFFANVFKRPMPARPHIKIYAHQVREVLRRAMAWALEGRTDSGSRAVR